MRDLATLEYTEEHGLGVRDHAERTPTSLTLAKGVPLPELPFAFPHPPAPPGANRPFVLPRPDKFALPWPTGLRKPH